VGLTTSEHRIFRVVSCHSRSLPAPSQSGLAEVFRWSGQQRSTSASRDLLGQMLGQRCEADKIWTHHQWLSRRPRRTSIPPMPPLAPQDPATSLNLPVSLTSLGAVISTSIGRSMHSRESTWVSADLRGASATSFWMMCACGHLLCFKITGIGGLIPALTPGVVDPSKSGFVCLAWDREM
jgi:hypothetical protein